MFFLTETAYVRISSLQSLPQNTKLLGYKWLPERKNEK